MSDAKLSELLSGLSTEQKVYFEREFSCIFGLKGSGFHFQRAKYIEDGLYLVYDGIQFHLYEIPLGGGFEDKLLSSKSLSEIIELAKTIC